MYSRAKEIHKKQNQHQKKKFFHKKMETLTKEMEAFELDYLKITRDLKRLSGY